MTYSILSYLQLVLPVLLLLIWHWQWLGSQEQVVFLFVSTYGRKEFETFYLNGKAMQSVIL